jgi:excisionase family DNA binding protein
MSATIRYGSGDVKTFAVHVFSGVNRSLDGFWADTDRLNRVENSFSPKQVAQALQVSESSVKRWCDRGVIRTDRTLGGHRRIPLEHLMEFLESTNRRLVDPSAIGLDEDRQRARERMEKLTESMTGKLGENPSGVATAQQQFEQALLSGDEQQCRRSIGSWYAIHGSMASVADELLAPTFHSIGNLWRCGDVDVYQERRGCEICIRLIHELRRLVQEPMSSAPLAMGGTSNGDPYQVANQLIEIIFREAGWRTINLGSSVPLESLLAAAKKYVPKIFWLSVTHVDDEEGFLDRFDAFSRELPRGVMLVVGGQALTDRLRPKMQFSAYCDSLKQLSALARNLRSSSSISGPQL